MDCYYELNFRIIPAKGTVRCVACSKHCIKSIERFLKFSKYRNYLTVTDILLKTKSSLFSALLVFSLKVY